MTSNDPVTFWGRSYSIACFHSSLVLQDFFSQNISPVNSFLGHSSISFTGALADLPVGFPYRFNSSLFIYLVLLFFFINIFFLSFFSFPLIKGVVW